MTKVSDNEVEWIKKLAVLINLHDKQTKLFLAPMYYAN